MIIKSYIFWDMMSCSQFTFSGLHGIISQEIKFSIFVCLLSLWPLLASQETIKLSSGVTKTADGLIMIQLT
jgi:hypothetical protein